MKKISAVIPTFNREKTIGRAIDSALAQKWPVSEVIVVDDGSTDGTRKIVEGYGARCRYISQENAGVSSARNRGVEEAAFDWIAFLDSDDYWLPDHLSRLMEAVAATRGEAAVYFCDCWWPGAEGRRSYWEIIGFRAETPYTLLKDAGSWAMRPTQPAILPASLIKRRIYSEVGGSPSKLRRRGDTLLFYKLSIEHAACAVPGVGAVVTDDGGERLTRQIGSLHRDYWLATLEVHRTMLAICRRSHPEWRKYFKDGLSAAHFSLARLSFRQRRPFGLIGHLVASLGKSPAVFALSLGASLGLRAKRAAPGPGAEG